MLEINGTKLEFDLLEADIADRYEQALLVMDKAASALDAQESLGLAESIRSQCRAIFDFFNAVFGEGTDKMLFGEKTNLGACLDAYDKIIDEANRQRLQYEGRLEKYYSAARAAR